MVTGELEIMPKIYFLLVLLLLSLVLQSCNSNTAQKVDTDIVSETSPTPTQTPQNENLPQSAKVEFKGVSFTYNPQIFEIKSESIIHETPLQDETEKPGGEFPTHIVFTLEAKNKLIEPKLTIKIMPIADYRRMYAISKSYTEAFDKNLDNLRKVLIDKKFRVKNEMPFIEFYDAHQTFEAKVRHFSFQSGKGILFLSQIN